MKMSNNKNMDTQATAKVTFASNIVGSVIPFSFGSFGQDNVNPKGAFTDRNRRRRVAQKLKRAEQAKFFASLVSKSELEQAIELQAEWDEMNKKDRVPKTAANRARRQRQKARKQESKVTQEIRTLRLQPLLNEVDRYTWREYMAMGFIPFHELAPKEYFADGYTLVLWKQEFEMYKIGGGRWAISAKLRNKLAHALNGNGESVREAQNEIGRDIEATLTSTDRSNLIDLQALKVSEESIPESPFQYLEPNTNALVCRRTEIGKFVINASTVVDRKLNVFDPFLAYYNRTLSHNSSLSTFRDVYFDLHIEVVVQSLPSVAGILHFAFDRFSTGLSEPEQIFALPTHMLDLSAKNSIEFDINMDLPFRVMNTVSTPFAASGNGDLFCYLATKYILPMTITTPVTVTIFATARNIQPYNLRPRAEVILQAALVPLDRDSIQDITSRNPATNRLSPYEIAKEWGFYSRTDIVAASVAGSEVAFIDLHPLAKETPMAHVAQCYSYYRGGMRIKLTVSLSKFQNLTLAAVFVPADATFDPTKYDAYAFTEIMFDEKHEAILNVGYSVGSNWLPIYVGDDINSRAAYGRIHVVVRSPLISTVTYANDPQLLVQVAAAEDFEVAHPRDFSKNFNQPQIIETDVNPEVPRRFATSSSNLYEDARLPVYYTRLELSENPYMIPVTCTRGNAGVLGMLKNTHAAWSGALDYIFVFEGAGQAEIRYDPTKRFNSNAQIIKGENMPSAGYTKFMNSRTNPHTHVTVPFCSIYDYLPTRFTGLTQKLTNGNCNGALLIAGKGTVRVYRAAGFDFQVHMYNSFDDIAPDTVADEPYTNPVNVEDPLENPALPTVAYLEAGFGQSVLGLNVEGINEVFDNVKETIPLVTEAVTNLNSAALDSAVTVEEVRNMLPEIRELLWRANSATETAHSAAESVCSLIAGDNSFAGALVQVATGGLKAIKALVVSIHGLVTRILETVTPECILQFLRPALNRPWTANELAMMYGIIVTAAAMALGIENTFAIVACVGVLGLAIPTIKDAISGLMDNLLGACFATAEKKGDLKLEAPSVIACGISLIMSIITYFIPNKDFGAKGVGESMASFSKIFSGAKALDEQIKTLLPTVLQIPGVSEIIGDGFQENLALATLDIQGFIDEVKECMSTDFYNDSMSNSKVRQQEVLWKKNKEIERMLSKSVTNTNFFFNQALRTVLTEQQRMYKHTQCFKGAGRERFPPFVLMIGGNTRVGKSYMAAHLQSMFCEMMNWDIDTDIYTRQPTDPYFTSLANQKIFYVDDLHTNITQNGADSDMSMLMSFATNAPWAPRIAAMEEKGRTVNALLGLFCTNTMGEPTFPGIRNTDAYLARRHYCVMMERVKEGYEADYSHARFYLIDPTDREGQRKLDANFLTKGKVKYYTFAELWQLISNAFVHHLIKERRNRHARKTANRDMEMPDMLLVELARKLADNSDDVDFVPIDELEIVVPEAAYDHSSKPTLTYMLGGTMPKYLKVLNEYHEDELANAHDDVYYVPATDSFVWKGRKDANFKLYNELLCASRDEVQEVDEIMESYSAIKRKIREYTKVLCECPDKEAEDDFLSCIEEEYVDVVVKGAEMAIKFREQAQEIGCVRDRKTGKIRKTWNQIKKTIMEVIPQWVLTCVAGLGVGLVVFYALRKLKDMFVGPKVIDKMSKVAERITDSGFVKAIAPQFLQHNVVTELQYEKPMVPAIAVPVKPTVESLVPRVVSESQYAKELTPAIAAPVKPLVPQVTTEAEYAKELTPAISVAPKPTVRKVLLPESTIPEEDKIDLVASYSEVPRAKENNKPPMKLESSSQINTAVNLFKFGRIGKIRRPGVMLHFYWLDDQMIYVNRHFWTVLGGVVSEDPIQLFWSTEAGPKAIEFTFNKDRVRCLVGTDHSCYMLPQRIQGIRNGLHLIATEAELSGSYPDIACLISVTDEITIESQRCGTIKRRFHGQSSNFYINLDGSLGALNHTAVYLDGFAYTASTEGGYCGSLLIFPHKGGKIFGIHTSSLQTGPEQGHGMSQFIYQEQISAMLESKETLFPSYDNVERIPAPVFEARSEALGCVLMKLECSYEPMIDVSKYGLSVVKVTSYTEATRGSMFTAYRKSFLDSFFPIPAFRCPAILAPGDKRAPYEYDPRPDILGKYNKVISPLPEKELQMVVEHLTTQYKALDHPCRPTELLNFEQAVNGIPEAQFFDAINFNTSPGLPYSLNGLHRKSSCFVEVGQYPNGRPIFDVAVPMVKERFGEILELAKQGKMCEGVVFQEFMKDELLKRKKIFETPATRGIANPPLDLLLAERAAFLPFIALKQWNRHSVDSQVGINALSGSEWSEMIHRLQENSDLVFDADYTAFDSTIHGSTLDAFADIVNGTMGGTEATKRARRTLIRYSYDRVSQVTNVQVKISQGMASGMPFTAVGNSEVNSIYLRVAWLLLGQKVDPKFYDLREFDKHVRMICYGDDNVVTVKAQVAEWFNLRAIALCLEQFGILMTDGEKNARHLTQPFSTWEKVRFLKREFKFDDKTGLYLAPIDPKTIIDRVRYVKSKDWWPDLQMRVEMSMIDCMMHGEKYFEAFKFLMNDAMREFGLPAFTVSYVAERTKWEVASALLKLEAGEQLTYSRLGRNNAVEVFHANDDRAPTQLGGIYYLRLDGPRPPQGTEGNVREIWQSPRTTIVTLPQASPPSTSTGGVSLEQIRDVITAALALRPAGVTLQQLQTALAALPIPTPSTSTGGVQPPAGSVPLPSGTYLGPDGGVYQANGVLLRPPTQVSPRTYLPPGAFINDKGQLVDAMEKFVDTNWKKTFRVKYPAAAGDEFGNYGVQGGMKEQVTWWLSRERGIRIDVINGRKYYIYPRGKADYPLPLINWNLCNILRDLGARDPIEGAFSHGALCWAPIHENIVSLADALFVKRRLPRIRKVDDEDEVL